VIHRTLVIVTAAAVLAAAGTAAAADPAAAPADSGMTLQAGSEGTVFRSLTVEGENRIRIDFDRPDLVVDLDPAAAPGLTWGSPRDVLDRTVPDLTGPLLRSSAFVPSPYTPRPWLQAYASGPVAVFATDLKGVDSWKLLVVDSRGAEVASFTGHGTPPKQIPWDGLDADGAPAAPGLTYSFVLETYDKAGNKRRFTGNGFQLPAYRREEAGRPVFLVSADQWHDAARTADNRPSALALAAASRFNLACGADTPLEIRVTGRNFGAAEAFGQEIAAALAPLVPGGATRLSVTTAVAEGAPAGGTAVIRVKSS